MSSTVEGVTEYLLDNGLKVLLFPDDSKEQVTVNITYLVGSRHEGLGEAGMAHLLEHMLFKGTPSFPDVKGALQDKGAMFNATTWLDRTNYFETMTSTNENLEFALHLEADRMINSLIRKEDLDSEMTVVRNEFEMGENNPVHVLHDQMMSSAYLWHNYGKSTIGNRSDIERVPIENLKEFYCKFYQPDNAVLLIAGKFDSDIVWRLINKYFKPIKRPTRTLPQTYTEEPAQDGPRSVTLHRTGDVSSSAIAYHIPSGSHIDHPTVQIMLECLTDEPGGLLYKSLVETGFASELYGMAYALAEPGMMMIFAKPSKNENAGQLLEMIISEVETKIGSQLTEKDVQRAKARLLKSIKLSMSDSRKIALRLSEAIATGSWKLFFMYRDRLKNVSLEDVKRVLSTYCIESNRTSGLYYPTNEPKRAHVPGRPDVAAMVESYAGAEETSIGEAFTASAEYIEKSTHRAVLAGKIKAAFLPKKTRGNAVRADIIFRFGNKESLTHQREAASLLPTLLMRGTTHKSFLEVQDALDELESSLHIYGSSGACSAWIQSEKRSFTSVIALLTEIMREPRFDAKEFEIAKNKEIKELEEYRSDPSHLASNQISRMANPFPKSSIHYVPTIDERLADLGETSLQQVRNLYEANFGANNLELSVVGTFEQEEVSNALLTGFSDWVNRTEYFRVIKPFCENIGDEEIIKTPDKQMATVKMATNFAMKDDDQDFPAVEIANYIFGQSMKSRLMHRIREREGLSYGAGSRISVSRHIKRANFSMSAICAPQNATKAKDAMLEEYKRWLDEGITTEELAESKISYRLTYENMFAMDDNIVSSLAEDLEIGRNFMHYENLLKKIENLSTEQVKNALHKVFGACKLSIVQAGDFG